MEEIIWNSGSLRNFLDWNGSDAELLHRFVHFPLPIRRTFIIRKFYGIFKTEVKRYRFNYRR